MVVYLMKSIRTLNVDSTIQRKTASNTAACGFYFPSRHPSTPPQHHGQPDKSKPPEQKNNQKGCNATTFSPTFYIFALFTDKFRYS